MLLLELSLEIKRMISRHAVTKFINGKQAPIRLEGVYIQARVLITPFFACKELATIAYTEFFHANLIDMNPYPYEYGGDWPGGPINTTSPPWTLHSPSLSRIVHLELQVEMQHNTRFSMPFLQPVMDMTDYLSQRFFPAMVTRLPKIRDIHLSIDFRLMCSLVNHIYVFQKAIDMLWAVAHARLPIKKVTVTLWEISWSKAFSGPLVVEDVIILAADMGLMWVEDQFALFD